MDSRKFGMDSIFVKHLFNYYNYKYSRRKPNLIISTDNHAYEFLSEYRDVIFPDVPVVFCGVNYHSMNQLKHENNFTGILEGLEIRKNLDLIIQMFPDTEEVIFLGDKTPFVEGILSLINEIKNEDKYKHLKMTIWNEVLIKDLPAKVKTVPERSVLFMTAIHLDKNKDYFSYDYDLKQFAIDSPVPVFGMWGGILLGNGIIGGYINDPEFHGKETVEIALKVLSGVSADDIPIKEKTKYYPQFDYNQLIKFDVDFDKLPKKSKIHFEPVSVFEEHKDLFISLIIIILVLLSIIIALYVNIQKRKLAEKKLAELNWTLELKVNERTNKLRKSNAQKDRLFSIISHDLRAPFNSLLGASFELGNDISRFSDKEVIEAGKIIYNSSKNISNLLDNLLKWSKIQIGQQEYNPEALFLNKEIDNISLLYQGIADEKRLTINKVYNKDFIVFADEFMINSVIRNLLNNAIKFSNSGSKIDVILENDLDYVKICVKDYGVGIEAKKLNKIFELGNQNSSRGTMGEQGSGLGLIICKEFIEMHKSELIVKSVPNKGSEFSFRLKKYSKPL